MKRVWNLLALLMASAVLVAACGAPPAGSGSYTVGDEIYGMTIQEISGSWHLIHFDPTDPTSQDLWYNPDTKQYMRVASFADGEPLLPRYAKAFKAELKIFGMNSTGVIKNTIFNGRPALIVPEVGVPVRYALQSGVLTIEHLESLIPAYIELHGTMYDAGVIVKDVGVFQATYVQDLDRLFIADVETVVFKEEAVLYEFMKKQYMQAVSGSINDNFAYYKKQYGRNVQPTAIAPIGMPDDGIPAGSVDDLFPIRFMSAIDGEITIKYATQEQLNRMKLGGEDLLAVTREIGVPMPKGKFGFWTKAGVVFSEVLFVADIVGTEYIIGINALDILGFGETKQLSGWIDTSSESLYSSSVIPQDILASETLKIQAEALAAEGFEKSPAYYVYFDHRHITDVLADVMHEIQPYRLDNHGSKSLGLVDDYDSVLPIAASSPDANTVEYVNVTTGDKIVWRLGEGGWTIVQGDSCMTFNAVVFNNRNEGIVMPFRFCTSTSGNVIFPVWWE